MSERYTPELGQWAFGAPTGDYAVSNLGSAAIAHLLSEMERVFWNRTGREISYRDEGDAGVWNTFGSGIEWHAYWWGEDDAPEAHRPNLLFSGVAIRWYKWPGRGESVDRAMLPAEWEAWLDRALQAARTADVESLRQAGGY